MSAGSERGAYAGGLERDAEQNAIAQLQHAPQAGLPLAAVLMQTLHGGPRRRQPRRRQVSALRRDRAAGMQRRTAEARSQGRSFLLRAVLL